MNDFAKKFVEALKSGKYTQTIGALRDSDGFCCLGIACDIFDSNLWKNYHYYNENSFLPTIVMNALGFSTKCGKFCDNGVYKTLIDLNDGEGLSFEEIAKIIESEPEGLFKE